MRRADLAGIGFLSLDRRHHAHRQAREICDDLKATLLEDYEGTSTRQPAPDVRLRLGFAILPELYLRSEVGGRHGHPGSRWPAGAPAVPLAAVWRHGSAYADSYATIADTIATEARTILAGPAL